MLAVALALNMLGTKILAAAATIGFVAELVGALIVGGWLLLTERHQNLSVLFDTEGVTGHSGGYLSAFLAAAIIGVYQYYGFEACGDVAEEVPDPTRVIPRAMRMTIYVGGAASILVCLSLLLAVPDFGAVISGEDPDPVISVLNSAFGTAGTKFVLVVVMISFLSCTLSLMAAASRLMYSYARDDMIFASHLLRHFDPKRHVPPYSMVIAAVIPAVIVLGSMVSDEGADLDRLLRDPRHLPRLPDGRARRAAGPAQGLGAVRGVHPRPLGDAGDRRRADLRRADDDQHRLAAHPRRRPGTTTGWSPSRRSSASASARSTWSSPSPTCAATPDGATPSRTTRRRHDVRTGSRHRALGPRRSQMKFSYVMLPDYPLSGVAGVDQEGRRARVPRGVRRRRDLAQGPLAALRRCRGRHLADPDGAERLRRRAARADADRAGRGDARRAHRRPRRGGAVERQLRTARAVQDRLGEDQAALPGQGGRRA